MHTRKNTRPTTYLFASEEEKRFLSIYREMVIRFFFSSYMEERGDESGVRSSKMFKDDDEQNKN